MSGNAASLHRGMDKSEKTDRRVRRTRDALGSALVALIQEKPFEEITVQHVLDRAGVSRSTFYEHYKDKNDLFVSDVDEFWEMMATALSRQKDKSQRVAPVQELFAHVSEVRPFIAGMTASGKMSDVMELGQRHFARGIEQRLCELKWNEATSETQRTAAAHGFAGALFSMLMWWMEQPREVATPEEMDLWFHAVVWGLARRIRN